MSKDLVEPRPSEHSEFQREWDANNRLAAVRESIPHNVSSNLAPKRSSGVGASTRSGVDTAFLHYEFVSQDFADIAIASQILRRVEPTLTTGAAPAKDDPHSQNMVRILIGLIWTMTTALIGGAIGAIVQLYR